MYAIRGPNVSSEVAALCVLHGITAESCPLYPVLLHGGGGVADTLRLSRQYAATFDAARPAAPLSRLAGLLEGIGDDDGGLPGPPGRPAMVRQRSVDRGGDDVPLQGCYDPLTFHLTLHREAMLAVVDAVVADFGLNEDQVGLQRPCGAPVVVFCWRKSPAESC